ncbi:MAG: methyltransferase [Chloroflexi bacterium]|nr:methyltransferase [Chloroflexota bacterium]
MAREIYRMGLRAWIRFAVRDHDRLRVEKVDGTEIVVLPSVFNGVRLRTGAFLAQTLNATLVPAGARVLDLGAGSGIGAIFAARWAARVVASDINPEAARCARINALAHHLEHKIETRIGDLFAPVGEERFDVILFNPPFYRARPRDLADAAWRSPDAFERFLRELPLHLNDTGRALVVLSSDGDIAQELAAAKRLSVRAIRQSDLINEILTVYEIRVAQENLSANPRE